MVNTPSTHHRKHVSKARAYKHAKHVSMPSTWARRHVSTQARKHAKHASTQARQARNLADSISTLQKSKTIKTQNLKMFANGLYCVKSVQIRSCSWSVFSHIQTEYRVSLRIQSKCGKIRTRINSVFGHFSRSVVDNKLSIHFVEDKTKWIFSSKEKNLVEFLYSTVHWLLSAR